jgi:hypothetical protein
MKAKLAIMMIMDKMPRLKTIGKCPKPSRRKEDGRSTKERRHPVTPKIRVANNLNRLRKVRKKQTMEVTQVSLLSSLTRSRRWHRLGQVIHQLKDSSTKSTKL